MFRLLIYFICINTFIFANEVKNYSICVCTTTSLENANTCKNNIKKAQNAEVFVLKDEKVYRTYLGTFKEYSQAKDFLDKSSDFVKKQKPFIKKLSDDLKSEKKEKTIPKQKKDDSLLSKNFLDELKILEDFKSMGSIIIDKYTPKITKC